MNPACRHELFLENGIPVEKAYIDPCVKATNNSGKHFVVLCPDCHIALVRNAAYTTVQMLRWKLARRQELQDLFGGALDAFVALKRKAVPLLSALKTIMEPYYDDGFKSVPKQLDPRILVINRKLKVLLQNNRYLLQQHAERFLSNLACVDSFLADVELLESARANKWTQQDVLFPQSLYAIFGIAPIPLPPRIMASTESLEALIVNLREAGKFRGVFLGIPEPYLCVQEEGEDVERILLSDVPRMRQLCHDYMAFRKTFVRLDCLNEALRSLHYPQSGYISDPGKLTELNIHGIRIIFVYEACLGMECFRRTHPKSGDVIVNLYDWKERYCIAENARTYAKEHNIELCSLIGLRQYLFKRFPYKASLY